MNGFDKILNHLAFDEKCEYRDEIVQAIRNNEESPSLMYIAIYYQRESICELLKKTPFLFDENEKINGLCLKELKALRAGKFSKQVKIFIFDAI